jgi:hypothetical protein
VLTPTRAKFRFGSIRLFEVSTLARARRCLGAGCLSRRLIIPCRVAIRIESLLLFLPVPFFISTCSTRPWDLLGSVGIRDSGKGKDLSVVWLTESWSRLLGGQSVREVLWVECWRWIKKASSGGVAFIISRCRWTNLLTLGKDTRCPSPEEASPVIDRTWSRLGFDGGPTWCAEPFS